jgi:HEAT repeat protein
MNLALLIAFVPFIYLLLEKRRQEAAALSSASPAPAAPSVTPSVKLAGTFSPDQLFAFQPTVTARIDTPSQPQTVSAEFLEAEIARLEREIQNGELEISRLIQPEVRHAPPTASPISPASSASLASPTLAPIPPISASSPRGSMSGKSIAATTAAAVPKAMATGPRKKPGSRSTISAPATIQGTSVADPTLLLRQTREARDLLSAVRPAVYPGENRLLGSGAFAASHVPNIEVVATNRDFPELLRVESVLFLGKLGDQRVVPTLRRLTRDPLPAVRYASASALSRFPVSATLPSLKRLMKDPNPLVRTAAAFSLGKSGDPAVLPALIPGLADRSALTRQTVLEALEGVPPAQLVPVLENLLPRLDAPTLGIILHRLGASLQRDLLPFFVKALQHPDERVREKVYESSTQESYPLVVKISRQAIRREEKQILQEFEEFLQQHQEGIIGTDKFFGIVKKMARFPMERKLELFRSLTSHTNPFIRGLVIRSLSDLPTPAVFSDLTGALQNDPHLYVQESAAEGLSRFPDRAEPYLLQYLERAQAQILLTTIKSLSLVGRESSLNRLALLKAARGSSLEFYLSCARERIRERVLSSGRSAVQTH